MGTTSLSYVTGVERGGERREKGEGIGETGKGKCSLFPFPFHAFLYLPSPPFFFAPAMQAKLVGCVEHLAKFC